MKPIKIISIDNATHNVYHIVAEKPKELNFKPGQAADVAINKAEWKDEVRPFTFTSLPAENSLSFHIKSYPDHNGVTEQIAKLKKGDSLLIGDVFGAIQYKGEGIFLAGGAGITPFIAILKDLEKQDKIGNNKLIFANSTAKDIVEKSHFKRMLGDNFINILSKEDKEGYHHGYITKEMIQEQIEGNPYFYLCGPPPMMDAVMKELQELGIEEDKIVKEDF